MSKVAQWQYTASDNDIQSMNVLPSNLMMWKAYDPLCRYRGSSPLSPCSYALIAAATSWRATYDSSPAPTGNWFALALYQGAGTPSAYTI